MPFRINRLTCCAGAAFVLLALIVGAASGAVYTAQPTLIVTCNLTNNAPGGQIIRYDGVTGQFIDRIVPSFTTPRGIAAYDGTFYVASANGNGVHRYNGYNGAYISGSTAITPDPVALGPDNYIYFASQPHAQLTKLNPRTGGYFILAAGPVTQAAGGIAFGPDGNLYIANNLTRQIAELDRVTGQLLGIFPADPQIKFIAGLTFGPDGDLYASDGIADVVWRIDGDSGSVIGSFTTGGHLDGPEDLLFGPDGNLYVASLLTDDVQRFSGVTGAFIDVFASGGGLDGPIGLTFFVPEPSSLMMVAVALIGGQLRRRRTR